MKKEKGFTLIEILITISIIIIIISIVSPNFIEYKRQQVLKNTTEEVVSLLNKARNNTIASKESKNYGVRFFSDKVILFSGLTYTESVDNEVVNFDSYVTISNDGGINLNGGSDEVVFSRLTGDVANYGSIKI
jgi:prepilin-type N-terminal cleavage/methylation domain-containing protein